MAPSHTSYATPASDLNSLRRGAFYLAATAGGAITGEYLGIETSHGEMSILLRHTSGTHSVSLDAVTSIEEIS